MSQMLFIELKTIIIPKGMDCMLNNFNINAAITEKDSFPVHLQQLCWKNITLNALH